MDSSKENVEKPFSVLEKLRQLRKEKELAPTSTSNELRVETPGSSIFIKSDNPTQSNGESRQGSFRGRDFGTFGKRSYHDSVGERPTKRISADLWRGQREADVGITEFVRNGPGFDVILKHRYTDFHVNEIDTDGNIVKFTSINLPKEEKPSTEETLDLDVLCPEQWEALKQIVEKKLPDTIEKDVTDLSKDERQKIHKAIKLRFGVHVYSNTNTVKERKVMKIGYGISQIVRHSRWPDGRPEYLHFVLYKENCETAEAIQVISRSTQVKTNRFGYAGTKDKRAVTTQQMCVRRTEAERFNKCSSLRGINVGNFAYKWNNLRLGDLSGNKFKLALRNVKVSDEVVKEAMESLKKNGFINYFGMQRFGQSALVPTYVIGQAILKGDWKLATELILKPRPGEATYRDVKEARDVWWETRDAFKATKCLSRKQKSIEGKILFALKKLGPNAYQNAFDTLPHYTVTLYLHSYQSLIWNKVVSRRVRQFGLKVLPGDLVRVGGDKDKDPDVLAYRWQEGDKDRDVSDEDDDQDDEVADKDNCKMQVHELSAEEAETASIFDVVYPLPGDDIRFPNNEIAGWYNQLLEADGHSMASFSKVNKKYGMYGTYRKMMETVEDLNWYIQRYSDPDEDVLQSDIDVYNRRPPLVLDSEGPYRAIVVEFNLKTCSYATMAIRELAKCETSVVNQTKLTSQAREEDLALKKLKRDNSESTGPETANVPSDPTSSTDNNCEPDNIEMQNGESSKKKMKGEYFGMGEGNEVEMATVPSSMKMEMESEDNVKCDSTVSYEINTKPTIIFEDSHSNSVAEDSTKEKESKLDT